MKERKRAEKLIKKGKGKQVREMRVEEWRRSMPVSEKRRGNFNLVITYLEYFRGKKP